jgi:hypothetical protein
MADASDLMALVKGIEDEAKGLGGDEQLTVSSN